MDEPPPAHDDIRVADAEARQVEQARNGDRKARAALIDAYHEAIFRLVFYRILVHADAEDLTQEIFAQALAHLPRLKDARRFKAWLYRIAVNRVRDFQRKRRFWSLFRSTADPDPLIAAAADPQPTASDQVLRRDFWRQVRTLMDKLSPVEQEVFRLRFFDHLSIPDIARVVRKKESTVKTHLYRALNKFRQETSLRRYLQEISE